MSIAERDKQRIIDYANRLYTDALAQVPWWVPSRVTDWILSEIHRRLPTGLRNLKDNLGDYSVVEVVDALLEAYHGQRLRW